MQVDLQQIAKDIFEMQTNTVCNKFREASVMYCETLNDPNLTAKILKHTDALLFKQNLAIINLEFLWQISDLKRDNTSDITEDQQYEWNNSSSIIDSTFFEGTITQIRAFIDFAQKLSLVVLGYTKPINGTKDFYKQLNKIDPNKSNQIKSAFFQIDHSWGKIVREIRDKIVHYDLIKTNHEFRPTLQGQSYEEFAQYRANDMFEFLQQLTTIVFEVDWVSGTFNEFKQKHNR